MSLTILVLGTVLNSFTSTSSCRFHHGADTIWPLHSTTIAESCRPHFQSSDIRRRLGVRAPATDRKSMSDAEDVGDHDTRFGVYNISCQKHQRLNKEGYCYSAAKAAPSEADDDGG
jgi:hypothetical protein